MIPMPSLALLDAFVDVPEFREFPVPEEEIAPPPAGGTGLEVCKAPAFGLPAWLGEALNIEHWWLKSGETEAGLGPNDATPDLLDTTIVDQTGDSATRDGAICAPLEQAFPEHADVDPECVKEAMTPGATDYGDYYFDGICKDTVEAILALCDPTTPDAPVSE